MAYFTTKDLAVGYDGNVLIHDIDIDIEKGKILTLIGPNGAGKSTILKSITRHLAKISGQVWMDGHDVYQWASREMAKQVAVVLTDRIRPELMTCQELVAMGVTNIITFDAHDPRVVNAIPIDGFESFSAYYQFMIAVFNAVPDIRVNPQELMIISPDEGAMGRAVYLANVLGVDMGMFYKRRDYTRLVNGRNPIIAHEFLGSDLKDKDVIVVDDMISSGDSMLDVCRQLKERGAARIIICATFGLFTNGMKVFDEYYEKGMFHKLITTNLVYQDPELLSRPYYETADMAKYLALIIDSLNHSKPISQTIDPSERIHNLLREQTVKNLMHI